jgi:hypothetical protein
MALAGPALRRCTAIRDIARVGSGEMSRDTFVLLYVLGSGALAVWVALCLPRLAPRSFRAGAIHLAVAVVVGAVLGPVLHAVPGLPSVLSVLTALFVLALPAITYMLLVGMWLVQLAVSQASSAGR